MATPDFVPNGNGEGNVGTEDLKWGSMYANNFHGKADTAGVADSAKACTGNAASATKATNDKNGKDIVDTYERKDSLAGKGNATTPVYIDANGVAQPITSYAGVADSAKVCTGNAATATKATNDKNGKDIAATYVPLSNEAYKAVTANGIHHNGIYRGKDWGTFNSKAAFEQFLADHNVSQGLFTDLYLGDRFTLTDGTFNKQWMIAGFDVKYRVGDSDFATHHLGLIPVENLTTAKMNDTNTTEGGYPNSKMATETIPAVDTAMTNILGTHLLAHRELINNNMNAELTSANLPHCKGATTWTSNWMTVKSCLMSEIEVYGCPVFSSSGEDHRTGVQKLPVFNFLPFNERRQTYWLRTVAYSTYFCIVSSNGNAGCYYASDVLGVRPLILVG